MLLAEGETKALHFCQVLRTCLAPKLALGLEGQVLALETFLVRRFSEEKDWGRGGVLWKPRSLSQYLQMKYPPPGMLGTYVTAFSETKVCHSNMYYVLCGEVVTDDPAGGLQVVTCCKVVNRAV